MQASDEGLTGVDNGPLVAVTSVLFAAGVHITRLLWAVPFRFKRSTAIAFTWLKF